MIGSAPCTQPLDELDAWLLDPDLEQLFAEVDAILCEARDRMRGRARPPVPGPAPRRATSPRTDQDAAGLRGRRPETGSASERGPPPGPHTTKPEREVMPESH
ncbi:hypothetical protein ACRS6B_20910 [Nocardia asteroides]